MLILEPRHQSVTRWIGITDLGKGSFISVVPALQFGLDSGRAMMPLDAFLHRILQ